MHSDQNRAFNYAVLASVALHALLLFGFTALKNSAPRAGPTGPLVARLVEPAPLPAPPVAAPVPPQAEPPKPAPREAAPKPKPRAAAKPSPKPSVPAPLPVPETAPAAPLAAEPAPAAPAAPPAAATSQPAAPAAAARIETAPSPPAAEAIDAGSLAQYRLQLISAARKYKRYPRVAMDNNWEGEVLVRMVIGANGSIAAVSVKTSSGYEVLDSQALDMFRKAKPQVEIPPALRGKEFSFEVRAIYNLKDQASG
jgi:TonB family protein